MDKSSHDTNSLIEILYQPVLNGQHNPTLFLEPHSSLVRKYDWAEVGHIVAKFARGMSATNIKRGSKVALICRNSVKSIIAAYANMLNGYVSVMLPLNTSIEEKLQTLSGSRTECVIVDAIEDAAPLLAHLKNLPQLRQVVILSEAASPKQPEILCSNWKEVMQRGESQPDRLALLRQAINEETEAFLHFQYDAKGRLTGALKTHGQILAECEEAFESVSEILKSSSAFVHKQSRILAILPFHHSNSFMLTVLLPMRLKRACMVLDPSESWKTESLSPRTTLLLAEAELLDSIASKVEIQITQHGGWREKLWRTATERGKRLNEQSGSDLIGKLYGKLLAKVMREYIGGRLACMVTVDNLPRPESLALYRGSGIPFAVIEAKPQEMIELRSAEL